LFVYFFAHDHDCDWDRRDCALHLYVNDNWSHLYLRLIVEDHGRDRDADVNCDLIIYANKLKIFLIKFDLPFD